MNILSDKYLAVTAVSRRVFGYLEPGQTSDNNVFGRVCYVYPQRPSAILTTEMN